MGGGSGAGATTGAAGGLAAAGRQVTSKAHRRGDFLAETIQNPSTSWPEHHGNPWKPTDIAYSSLHLLSLVMTVIGAHQLSLPF